jgi:hypothetical protein
MSTDVRPTISQDAMRLLKRVAAGDFCYAERTYPFDYRFHVVDQKTKASAVVSSATASQLIERRLLVGKPRDAKAADGKDWIQYSVSAAGKKALKLGDKYVHPASGQDPLFDLAAYTKPKDGTSKRGAR